MLQQKKEYFASLIELYGDMIYRYALLHMKNEAEAQDIYQDVFLKLFEKDPDFLNNEHARAWLLRVCINLCKNRLRYHFSHLHKTLLETYAANEDKKDWQFFSYLKSLPQNYRTVLYLFYYEEYSTKEIAELLGKKDATIRTWLSRGKQVIKDEIKKEGE